MSTAMTMLESGNSRLASHGSFRTPHTALRHAASAASRTQPEGRSLHRLLEGERDLVKILFLVFGGIRFGRFTASDLPRGRAEPDSGCGLLHTASCG